METSDFISLGALVVSGLAVYYTYESNKRAKRKEELESRTLFNVSCEYDFYNNNVVKIGEENYVGQGLRFSLVIHNYGFRHLFIQKINLMGSNQLSIHSIHEFSLKNNTKRNLKSTDDSRIELWIPIEKLKKLIGQETEKTIFIRVISENDKFFDSNSTRIKIPR